MTEVAIGCVGFALYALLAANTRLPRSFRVYAAGTAATETVGWAAWFAFGDRSAVYATAYVIAQIWLSAGCCVCLLAIHRGMRGSSGRLCVWAVRVLWGAWLLRNLSQWSYVTVAGFAVRSSEMAFTTALASVLLDDAKPGRTLGTLIFGLGVGSLGRDASLWRFVTDRGGWEATAQVMDLAPWLICWWAGRGKGAGILAGAAGSLRLPRAARKLLPARWRGPVQARLF